MIIKFNFTYSTFSSQEQLIGTLKITQLENAVSPIYDIILNEETNVVDKTELFKYAIEQYIESRIFEIFNQSRNQNIFLSKEDYKNIISREAPVYLIDRVLDNMQSVIEEVEVRQAS